MTSRFSSLVAALVVAGGGLSVEAGTEECRTRLAGDFGRKLEACYRGSVRTADMKGFTDAFATQTETTLWQTEFWGKWMHAAVPLAISVLVELESPPGSRWFIPTDRLAPAEPILVEGAVMTDSPGSFEPR